MTSIDLQAELTILAEAAATESCEMNWAMGRGQLTSGSLLAGAEETLGFHLFETAADTQAFLEGCKLEDDDCRCPGELPAGEVSSGRRRRRVGAG